MRRGPPRSVDRTRHRARAPCELQSSCACGLCATRVMCDVRRFMRVRRVCANARLAGKDHMSRFLRGHVLRTAVSELDKVNVVEQALTRSEDDG